MRPRFGTPTKGTLSGALDDYEKSRRRDGGGRGLTPRSLAKVSMYLVLAGSALLLLRAVRSGPPSPAPAAQQAGQQQRMPGAGGARSAGAGGPPPPPARHSGHRKQREARADGGAEDGPPLEAQVRAEQALLVRSKMMSQAQLDMVMNVMEHRGRASLGVGAEKRRGGGGRKGSSCLTGAALQPGGNLTVNNLGGAYSSWAKRLGGENDPKYIHMAMTERLGNGSLVVMWQQAPLPIEGTQAQAIFFTISKDDTPREWYPERRLDVPSAGALWSPVMHFQDGTLYVLYSESRDCIRPATANAPPRWFPGGDVKMTGSQDLEHWDKPLLVYSQDHDFGVPKVLANKMIVTHSGDWVLPFWREIPRGGKALTPGKCVSTSMRASAGVLVSKDKGKHWRALGEVTHPLTWLIENTVVELGRDNSLLMLFRTWAGRIFQSNSADGGKSWSMPMPLAGLPNPDAKIHAIRLEDSTDLMLAFNDHQKYADDGFTRFRTALRLAISQDHGATWTRVAQVDEIDEPGWQFHYPTIMQYGCNITVAYSRTYVASTEDNLEDNSAATPSEDRPGIRIMSFDLMLLRGAAAATERR